MRLPRTILFLLTFFTLGHALALPGSLNDLTEASKQLFKRKGGGGGGGRGGGSGSTSSGGSRGSNGGSTSSSSPSGSGRTSSSSNLGGSTRSGSGSARGYGGGKYYGGGAAVPYGPGQRRTGLGAPILLGAGAGALVLFPAFALYGAYSYGYPYYWLYRNNTSGRNESHPAECWCAKYQPCSCDPNNDTDYINNVANNAAVAKLARLNNTDNETLIINGTLENGTTAPGGTDDAEGAAMRIGEMMGYWPMVAVAFATAYML